MSSTFKAAGLAAWASKPVQCKLGSALVTVQQTEKRAILKVASCNPTIWETEAGQLL